MTDRNVYLRGKRWWGDFRDFPEVGGDREPLRRTGESFGTTDQEEAEALYDARLADLQARRSAQIQIGQPARLRAFAPKFLRLKARLGDAKKSTLKRLEQALRVALHCLKDSEGEPIDPYMHTFTPADAGVLMEHVREYVSLKTGTMLSSRSQRYALDAVAELFDYAQFQGHVPSGFNPVRSIPARVKVRNRSYHHLDMHEAAALLEGLVQVGGGFTPPVVQHFVLALTGARPEEGAALTRADILLESERVRIDGSKDSGPSDQAAIRYVQLAPMLRLVLEAYQQLQPGRGRDRLLTYTHARKGRTGEEIPIRDSRKLLDSALTRAIEILDEAGLEHEIHRKRLVRRSWRPTYCTTRLQTLQDGRPIAPHTVMLEMGHQSLSMINRIYNRLGKVSPRKEFVEYRLPDGRLPGEDLLREILGEAAVDPVVTAIEAPFAEPAAELRPLRLVR